MPDSVTPDAQSTVEGNAASEQSNPVPNAAIDSKDKRIAELEEQLAAVTRERDEHKAITLAELKTLVVEWESHSEQLRKSKCYAEMRIYQTCSDGLRSYIDAATKGDKQ